jgi:hypothetical protein
VAPCVSCGFDLPIEIRIRSYRTRIHSILFAKIHNGSSAFVGVADGVADVSIFKRFDDHDQSPKSRTAHHHSLRRTSAVGVDAAMRPGIAAATLTSNIAPNATNTSVNHGTEGSGTT